MNHTTKTRKTEEAHEIGGKVTYVEKLLYKLDLPADLHPSLKVGKEIEEGDLIKSQKTKAEYEIHEIRYKGITDLLPGARVRVGDEIYKHKSLLGKKSVKSSVSGLVKEIDEEVIKIEIHDEIQDEPAPFKSPFGGKVKTIQDKYLLLEFSAVQVNLFESKGGSAVGPIKYMSSAQIKDRKNLPARVEKSIIVTEQITAELYPMLSTLGVGAIIANSIDYSLYKNMIILAVPIGIISGFGYTPNEKKNTVSGQAVASHVKSEVRPVLNEDEALIKYIKSIEGKTVWVDGDYGRLIIPETKEPVSLKKHKFLI